MRTIDKYPDKNPYNDTEGGRIIGWISGGVASAVACKLAIDHYGSDRVTLAFCDTSWEHPDTYRFLDDLRNYFNKDIEMLKSTRMSDPHKYEYMAKIEHDLSKAKYLKLEQEGRLDEFDVVTICKDQRTKTKGNRLFLSKCEAFPEVETIDVIKGRQPVTMFECNGFCHTK